MLFPRMRPQANNPLTPPKGKRPVIALERTQFEKTLEIVALAALLFMIFYLIFTWSSIPEQVPSHFGIAGEPDAWSGKGSILILPIVSIFVYALLTILSRYPHVYNYFWPITEENARDQYLLARQLIVALKALIVCFFSYLVWRIVEVARGHAETLGSEIMILFMALLAGTVVIYFIKAYRAR